MVLFTQDTVAGDGGAEAGSTVASEEEAGRNTLPGVDAPHPLGTLPDEPVADGRCAAVALTKARVFTTVVKAVEALDHQRDDWTRIRDDFQEDTFLGTRGHSWHRQIIKRTVIQAGFDFRLVPVLDMNSTDSYLVDGVANDRYLVDDEWVQPYELDSPDDNPRDNPRNWQHIVAVVKGNIKRTFTSVSAECLHLDWKGLPDPNKGFFRKIDRVYRISKKEAEEGDEQTATRPRVACLVKPAAWTRSLLGRRVYVIWNGNQKYYGMVASHRSFADRPWRVKYDDGDIRWEADEDVKEA